MLYNKLPLYKMVLDDGEDLGVSKISLVEFPAVEEDFLLFENKEPKEYKFKVQDEEKHIVSGIVMVADRPIYREDSYGKGYYVVFPKESKNLLSVLQRTNISSTFQSTICMMLITAMSVSPSSSTRNVVSVL